MPIDLLPMRHWLVQVSPETLRRDAVAGLTSAVVVLPQGIAFAAIAGLPVEYGLYTAIIVPVIAALFGSSRHMISGPTTAISVLVFGSLSMRYAPGSSEYIAAALAITLLAGLFQVAMALLRLGSLANFVSDSVMIGFTAGAAVVILMSQLPAAAGIAPLPEGADIATLVRQIDSAALSTAVLVLVVAMLVKRFSPQSPHYLIGLAAGALYCAVLDFNDIAYVSPVNQPLPIFSFPAIDLVTLKELAPSAIAIALVGLLEATAIARGLSLKSGDTVRINQEFFGQGLSNTIGSVFACYVGSGSFTRSALNYESGAQTQFAAIFASLFLFTILFFLGPYLSVIPVPGIVGIILLVAWRLIEFEHIRDVLRSSKYASAVMISTFAATLLIGLEFGIYLGVFVSLGFFLRRSANPYLALTAPDPTTNQRVFRNAPAFGLDECPQLGCARLDGMLYFGSLDEVRKQLRRLEEIRPEQRNLLLFMKGVGDVDLSGARLLVSEQERRAQRGGRLFLTARRRQVSDSLGRTGVIASVGHDNVFNSKGEAIEYIFPQLDPDICARCDKRIFKECPQPDDNGGDGGDGNNQSDGESADN